MFEDMTNASLLSEKNLPLGKRQGRNAYCNKVADH